MVEYRICSRCILDTTDSEIEFDENGFCNHCKNYFRLVKENVFTGKEGVERFRKIADKIKEDGKDKKYDCIIGLSGGLDSSYAVFLAKRMGLKPLVVHLDNGWNSKIAVRNIHNLVKKLELDLYTYVINWEEFKDLQLSYLKASVIDIEAITDHAIKAALYKVADEKGIKYILTGTNLLTEGIIPKSWRYNKSDLRNIKDIRNKFGKIKLKTFPMLSIPKRVYYEYIKKIVFIPIIDYFPYDKKKVKEVMEREFGWQDYGTKHGESKFTKFYQEYILPKKFGVDKRKAHFSTLICAGQMTREEALKEIKKSPYNEEELDGDIDYVTKKFGITREEFEKIMNTPPKSHLDYKSSVKYIEFLRRFRKN